MKIQSLHDLLLSTPNTEVVDIAKIGNGIPIAQAQENIDIGKMKDAIAIGNDQADLGWKKTYYKLRTVWATLSIILLALSLLFTYWLVDSVGRGRLDFTKYQTFLNIIAGTIIVDVLGLVAIVMHFLFPNDIKKPTQTVK